MNFRAKIIFLVLALLPGTPSISHSGELDQNEIAEVEQILADYRAAWLAGESESVLSILSDKVLLFVPGSSGGRIDGKAAVRDIWFPPSDRSYPIREYEVSDQEIFGTDDLAVASGKSELVWETVEAGKVLDRTTSRSDFITILRKEDGHWRIYRQMYQMRN